MYDTRTIPRAQAARAARINLNALDVFIHRYGAGANVDGKRVFSLRDLVVMTTARALAGPDRTIAEGLAIAAPLLWRQPAKDAVLIVTADDGWLQADADEWPECNCSIVPAGRFLTDIRSRVDVAIH